MSNYIKVLPLPDLVEILPRVWGEKNKYYYYEDCRYKEIPPVFNRNGRYFDRKEKRVWQEYEGKAFIEPRIDDFEYSLSLLSVRLLTKEEMKALHMLFKNRLLTKELRKILQLNEEKIQLRRTYVDAKICCMKSLKEFKEGNNI